MLQDCCKFQLCCVFLALWHPFSESTMILQNNNIRQSDQACQKTLTYFFFKSSSYLKMGISEIENFVWEITLHYLGINQSFTNLYSLRVGSVYCFGGNAETDQYDLNKLIPVSLHGTMPNYPISLCYKIIASSSSAVSVWPFGLLALNPKRSCKMII